MNVVLEIDGVRYEYKKLPISRPLLYYVKHVH